MNNCHDNNKAHVMKKTNEIVNGKCLYICNFCNHSLNIDEVNRLIQEGKYGQMVSNHDTTVFEMK